MSKDKVVEGLAFALFLTVVSGCMSSKGQIKMASESTLPNYCAWNACDLISIPNSILEDDSRGISRKISADTRPVGFIMDPFTGRLSPRSEFVFSIDKGCCTLLAIHNVLDTTNVEHSNCSSVLVFEAPETDTTFRVSAVEIYKRFDTGVPRTFLLTMYYFVDGELVQRFPFKLP